MCLGMVRAGVLITLLAISCAGCGSDPAPGAPGSPSPGPSITLRCAIGTGSCAEAMQGQTVTFTAERGTTTIRSATLDFGDGSSADAGTLSTATTLPHAYAQTGTFTARLTATESSGQSQTATQEVRVGTVVTASMSVIDLGGLNVLATADVGGAPVVRYEWVFEGTTPNVTTTTNQARYTFSTPGFKDVSMRASLGDGRVVRASAAVVVE